MAAQGGSFLVGGSGGTDSQFASFMLTPGELIDIRTPAQQRAMGSGSNVNVNIFNNSGSQVETQQSRNSSGGIDIDVMIDRVVGKNIRRGGQTFSAIRDTFGTSVRTVGR